MAYYLVNTGMSLATMCFVIGYLNRLNIQTHRIWMLSGVSLVLLSALILIGSIYFLYGGDRVAAGFVQSAPDIIILIHRIIAVLSVVFMALMVKTGIKRQRQQHILFSRYFISSYLLVYISGLFIFQSAS